MAFATTRDTSVELFRNAAVNQQGSPGSARSAIFIVHEDCRSLPGAGSAANPGALDDTDLHWVRMVPGATRVRLRTLVPATSTITTALQGVLVGAWVPRGAQFAGPETAAWPSGTRFARVDAALDADPIDVPTPDAADAQTQPDATLAGDFTDAFDAQGPDYLAFVPTRAVAFATNDGVCKVEMLVQN